MRKTKLEKGITLIALIITIVVLLILAVVSIGAIKNSKIISHSQNAADEWKKAQEDENKLLEGYLEQIESNLPDGELGEEVSKDKIKEGQKVSFDKKTWTILYNNDTCGLQMICDETYQYNNKNFYLGYNDSSITDWDSLDTSEDEDYRMEDLNKNRKLDTDLEKSIYSYNNAITTLNTACEKLFKDESGNYKNSNITDVRCVGSNPINKNSENADFCTSENLAKWPEGNSTYSEGIGNGKGKSTDSNYSIDFSKMQKLGINKSDTSYWLASRIVYDFSNSVGFCMSCADDGNYYIANSLWYVGESRMGGDYDDYALRPVISLSSAIQLTPSEPGSTTDYILE